MAQVQGAYRLGKAIIEHLEALQDKIDVKVLTEGDKAIESTDRNTHLVKLAIIGASKEAGFMNIWMSLLAMMKTYPNGKE